MIERLRRINFPFLMISLTVLGLAWSYQPLIKLGSVNGVHIDLSLLYVIALMASVSNIPQVWQQRKKLWSLLPWRIMLGFQAYLLLGTLWSQNSARAVFTALFSFMLFIILSTVIVHGDLFKKYAQHITPIAIPIFIFVILFALWQIIASGVGLDPALTLLPPEYQARVFGIARPVGFALEPQFFASLLLFPTGWFLWRSLTQEKIFNIYVLGFAVSVAMLFLTISRGGLLAAGVLLLLILVFHPMADWKKRLKLIGLSTVAFAIGCTMILLIGSLYPQSGGGPSTLSRIISQLTLGVVDSKNQGYAAGSSSSRLAMSDLATNIWASSASRMVFGVGTGGFGAALHNQNSFYPVYSVVNNYYLEILAELGVIGVILFASFVFSLMYLLYKRKDWFFIALLSAYLIQWSFFSGNANVVHIWVAFGFALYSLTSHKRFSAKNLLQ